MNYFLVDYENVNVSGLDGVSKLTENDVVIIFYSENAETLTFGVHRRINESKAEIKFQKVVVKEKNSLDFQLCTYLGYLIRDTMVEKNNYFIVSNDKGYAILPDYCRKFKIDLKIVSNLAENGIEIFLPEENNSASELENELSKIFSNQDDIEDVVKIIKNSTTKIEVNNNLGKKFSSQRGGEIYRAVKKFLADKK